MRLHHLLFRLITQDGFAYACLVCIINAADAFLRLDR
jgi:hypothetical protein